MALLVLMRHLGNHLYVPKWGGGESRMPPPKETLLYNNYPTLFAMIIYTQANG